MGKNEPGYLTKQDLHKALRKLHTDLRRDLRVDLRQDLQHDMRVMLDAQTELIREELNYKLGALENRMNDRFTATEIKLMAHTEDVVGSHAADLLENIASVVDPNNNGLKGSKLRRLGTA